MSLPDLGASVLAARLAARGTDDALSAEACCAAHPDRGPPGLPIGIQPVAPPGPDAALLAQGPRRLGGAPGAN